MQEYAKKYQMVIVVPIYEEEMPGVYYNTAAVIDADGSFLGKYRKTHIPQVAPGFYEKFFFKPGNLGYPVFDTAYVKLGVYICYDLNLEILDIQYLTLLTLNWEFIFVTIGTSLRVGEH